MVRLPSLNALRAFEAAARHGSLTRAAAELHVTHSAVSHQIRALETEIGAPLLRRLGRGVQASAAGAELEAALTDAFGRIERAVERARGGDRVGILTVSVEPSFAARWLVLRLGRFRAAHPEIDLRLAATTAVADFTREDVDAAIRHGRGPWPGLAAVRLLPAPMFPVCSPELLAHAAPPTTPAELARFTLIHEDDDREWREWLAAAGAPAPAVGGGVRFDDGNLVLAAALAGQGVALTDDALAGEALADGRLVRLSEAAIATDKAYWLVHSAESAERPKVAAFRAWLLAETERQLGR
jgi:LysR family transcriptional regulator, glycine cleavage system transcriptional activator